jgi:hypothetical protein
VLDWICQISGKGWDERWPGCTKDFVKAIRDIIDPQANLCSFAIRGGPRDHCAISQKEMKAFLLGRISEPSEAEQDRTWAWAYGYQNHAFATRLTSNQTPRFGIEDPLRGE